MAKIKTIVAGSTSPTMPCGNCPTCGSVLRNPSKEQHKGLSMTVRWLIPCSKCGQNIIVENPRYFATPTTSATRKGPRKRKLPPLRANMGAGDGVEHLGKCPNPKLDKDTKSHQLSLIPVR